MKPYIKYFKNKKCDIPVIEKNIKYIKKFNNKNKYIETDNEIPDNSKNLFQKVLATLKLHKINPVTVKDIQYNYIADASKDFWNYWDSNKIVLGKLGFKLVKVKGVIKVLVVSVRFK